MSFAWSVSIPEVFPDLSPAAFLPALTWWFSIEVPYIPVPIFWFATMLPTTMFLAVFLHARFSILWILNMQAESRESKASRKCRLLLLRPLLFACWLSTTVAFLPLMRKLLSPMHCCFEGSEHKDCMHLHANYTSNYTSSSDVAGPLSSSESSSHASGYVIGTNSSSSNFLLAGCFSEDHFPKYLTSLVFWPLLAWYATRLRRLQGKALMMSTSLTEWNLDVYELSAQDESKFSMHNGNYIQRAYVFLCVSTLLANVVLWSEPARLSVVFFILLPSGPNTNQRSPHANDESLDHVELGSRRLAVRTST